MIVYISSDAEDDLIEGYWFYERQQSGLGDYFRSCLISDIESLAYFGGIHEKVHGLYRALSNRFPFCLYYRMEQENVIVVAVIDARRNPSWIRNRLS